ncbi:hypothetical protein [Streptomyces acidiscabies]|uniref:hypothetical protein n=1 Tax=Streptomyces acidiscabies TaxID=42234 RepID=UPI000951BE8E|nr:hypothetical protein [Streptomyces acidiscabies]
MSWRRLRVLIEHLPAESATWTALRNELSPEELATQAEEGEPEKGRWSQEEQLLATVVDAVRRVEWVLWSVNIEQQSQRPDPPEPMRRPGAGPRKVKAVLAEGRADELFQMLNGGAA